MCGFTHSLGIALAICLPLACEAGSETITLEGTYRLEMREVNGARLPLLGRTRTAWNSVALARLRWQDGVLLQEHRLCEVRFDTGVPLVRMTMPDPMRESLGRSPYAVALERGVDGAWRYHADMGFEHVGYLPEVPGSRPPRRPADEAVVDSDGDGKPGVTLHLSVGFLDPFELYVVQRRHAVLDGHVLDDGRVEGGMIVDLDQKVIGSDPQFLDRDPQLEPDPQRSHFSLVPVADESTCESLVPVEDDAEGRSPG